MDAHWRPTEAVARLLTWFLVAFAIGQVLSIAYDSGAPYVRMHDAVVAEVDGHTHQADRILNEVSRSGSSVVSFVNLLAVAVTLLLVVWAWRSGHNARALGRTGERIAPALGIFGWIVPIASWVLPYLVVSDLWRSSDPESSRGTAWRALPGAVVVRAWWVCFAGGQVLATVAIGLAMAGTATVARTDTLLDVAHTVTAIGAVLTIPVIAEITRRQLVLQARDPAPLAAAPARVPIAPVTPGGPGWYADPAGQFEQRYWDGHAWTERVLDRGAPAFAPITAPGWYDDPTGRFPLRYWTGYAWTEHVSRGDDLLIDPVA